MSVAVPLFARCSLLLWESPPVFARPATSFSLLVQRKGGKRKHLTTHLASSQSGCNTAQGRRQLASRLEQCPLDAQWTFHGGAAHTSPHGTTVILRRRVGPSATGAFTVYIGGTVRAARRVVPWHGGVGEAAVPSLGQMGCQVLSLPSFFAPAKKEGRRPGEFRRALPKEASTARESGTANAVPQAPLKTLKRCPSPCPPCCAC